VSSLADRLRGVVRPSGGPEGPPLRDDQTIAFPGLRSGGPSGPPDAAVILGGEWRELRGRKFLVVERRYSAGYRHGRVTLADCLPPWPRFELLGLARRENAGPQSNDLGGRLLFLDLETTGLAGGAGTYAFLVGCGWFESCATSAAGASPGCFRTRQFLLTDFTAERALLEAVGELAAGLACVVTYNGKTFDLPLLETRFSLQRMPPPFTEVAHVDMLHPARRMWREEEVECRLTYLEQTQCGHEREDDVPGFEIPSRYFHYVRSGDPRPLEAVFEHNRLDIVSLAMLTARAAQLLEEGASAAGTAREAFGLGRLYERAGLVEEALRAFTRAAEESATNNVRSNASAVRVEGLRAAAILLRRLRRYEEAAAMWRDLLAATRCPPAYAAEASEALAVHHEHRVRDLHTARAFALRSLTMHGTPARQHATQHRLARLDRKLGGTAIREWSPALF
jgi:uncharacterized protein YprB with RNaseH-like and TPR domain